MKLFHYWEKLINERLLQLVLWNASSFIVVPVILKDRILLIHLLVTFIVSSFWVLPTYYSSLPSV